MSESGVWDLDIAGSISGSEIDNRLKTLEETIHEYEIYHLITEGTTGSVEKPTHGDIIMDQYPAGGDCIVVQTDSTTQKPIEALVYDASGVLVEGTLDINGNYTLSGVPAIYPVALVFQVSLAEMYKTLELSNDRILTEMQIPNAVITSHEDLSNINQAGTGVLNGHISDQAQTIAGAKTYSGTAMFNEAVTFKGDIIQQGTGKITYTEDVRTKKDLITLRDGAITGLDIGECTGLRAKLYDGVNDGLFVIDRDGYFKVGDEGNLVTLTGREDSPIDQAFGYWDDTTKIFKTKTISSSDLTDNSSIVKTSGTQTIEGAKTFSDTIVGSISGNATTATLATQALAIKPLGNSITLAATPTSVTKIIKIATVGWVYTGTINIACTGGYISDGIKVCIDGETSLTGGIRVIYGKNNTDYGIKKIIVTRTTEIWSSSRNIYAEIVTSPTYTSTTTLGVVETNRGAFTPSMTEVSSVEGTVLDSLSLDYLRGDISSYQHEFTKSPTAPTPAAGTNNTQIATTAWVTDKIEGLVIDNTSRVAEYTGDGGSTTILDRAGNGNNLTATDITYVNGKYGKEMSFNGSTSYAQASSPVIGTTGTIALRFKRNTVGVNHNFVSNFTDTTNGLNIRISSMNTITLYTYGLTGEVGYNLKTGFTDVSNYHTGVLRITGSQIIFMFDGVDYTFTQTADMVSGLANLTLGRRAIAFAGYDNFLDGIISHFRYDSRIWSAEEARAWSLNPISIDSRV
jgi:hypothetical protein